MQDVGEHYQIELRHGALSLAMGKRSPSSGVKLECLILAEPKGFQGSYWLAELNKEPQPKPCVASQAFRMADPIAS